MPHPAHVTVVDLDEDGRRTSWWPTWESSSPAITRTARSRSCAASAGGGYAPFHIGGFPRVADVEAGDFDGDGRLDLVVAAFGWFRTGEITLLLNRTQDWSEPVFERKVIDAAARAPIHVIPTDLDGDGRLDFVALLAQHYESVVAFLGDGKGGFRSQTLYAAPHPNWGSSGIQLADLDGDGDLDVLATNGDMFDDDILKPYHGVQWLENRGKLRFDRASAGRICPARTGRWPATSTATATRTWWPRRSPARRPRPAAARCPPSCGSSRGRAAASPGTPSPPGGRSTPRQTWATWTATETSTS